MPERTPKLFWIGLAIYAVSFFLIALSHPKNGPALQPVFGFFCAWVCFVYPWIDARLVLFHGARPTFDFFSWASLLISGWINPLFLFTAFFQISEFRPRLASFLKYSVVVMIPFSWFFAFYTIRTYPREGHVMWILGMLLVLFSNELTPRVS
jgi:hypothetical protein